MDKAFIEQYTERLGKTLARAEWDGVSHLAKTLLECQRAGRQVFMCGNGGSAANAVHLANDFLCVVDHANGTGLRAVALSANASVLTSLANDVGYEEVFSRQLSVLANKGDVLVAFSGSGNSPNILKCLETARTMGVTSFALLGFDGGRARTLADHALHFAVDDMQVAEDIQLVVGHMIMQWLAASIRS